MKPTWQEIKWFGRRRRRSLSRHDRGQDLARGQRTTPAVVITAALLQAGAAAKNVSVIIAGKGGGKVNILHRLHSKQNVPELLNSPADSVAVGKVGVGNPVENAFVGLARTFADALAGQDKLTAAQVANSLGNLVHWHLQQVRVQFEEGVVDIGVLVVNRLLVDRNKGVGAARDASASQVDEAVGVDRLVAEETQSSTGLGTKQLVVPLLIVGVDKDVVGG